MHGFRDGFFPYVGGEVKDVFEELKARLEPDLIFTHAPARPAPGPPARLRADVEHVARPPDPRVRDPEVRRRPRHAERLRPVSQGARAEKARLVREAFASQSDKHWFDEELFLGLMRLRGMEARAPSGYAEAFTCRKLSLRVG